MFSTREKNRLNCVEMDPIWLCQFDKSKDNLNIWGVRHSLIKKIQDNIYFLKY